MSLFDRRLVVVSGKGGVGKSTVAAALAVAAARDGRRVLLADVAGGDRLAGLFDLAEPIGFARTPVRPHLDAMSVDPQRALEEYLLANVPARALLQKVLESRMVTMLTAAAPGLRELVALGVLTGYLDGDGRRGYDTVVVDGPATGHGVAMLRVPRTFLEVARSGPLAPRAEALAWLVEDAARTAVVLVATPEELPVTEALEAAAALRADGLPLAGVVVNAAYPPLFAGDEVGRLATADPGGRPLAAAALRAAASRAARTEDQREQIDRLGGDVLAELPFLFEARVGAAAVGALAGSLEGL